ncbi:MAG TPA: MFS transporter [Candidatus Limnocylindria bacterium]|nr:MFS transporter [Candidatus Limnocylindria bacterium]
MRNGTPGFGVFWLAQAVSRFGDPITLIALATVTYERTGSALFTALAVVIATIPTAVFGFFAGAVADALGHRRAMFVSDIARVVLIGAVPVLLERGAPLIVAYLLVFVAAIFGAVFNPARIAIIPALVPPERLASANSTVAATDRTVEILGALAAGFLVATIGAAAFYVDAATFAISAVLLVALRVRSGETRPFRLSHLFADAFEGVRFLLRQPVLRVNTYFSLAAQLALPVVNGLTPVYLVRRFANGDAEFGAALFGVAEAALAAGAVGAGLTLPEYMTQFRKGQLIVVGFASYGTLLILLGLAPSLLPAMVIFFLMGVANVVFVVPNITISQEITPPALRARVFGARAALLNLTWLPIIVVSGALADRVDAGLLIAIAGGVTLATALFAVRFVPQVSEVA